jgi:peptidoglycan/LPS O-acetylase OafA/YrhL
VEQEAGGSVVAVQLEAIQPNRREMPAAQTGLSKDDHYILLDVMRTLAAFGVICWHWQHFYMADSHTMISDKSIWPFYTLLRPFYEAGWMAVDFFFMLSGFVMSWTYLETIRSQATGPFRFAVLRLSRLYPLHFLTLLLVAVLQYVYTQRHGHAFIYQFNNLYHFGLQLPMASQWGFQRGPSFNDPIWSVSIEVLLYAAFFLLVRFTGFSVKMLGAISVFGFVLIAGDIANGLGRGLFCFFIGCLLAEGLKATNRSDRRGLIEKAAYLSLLIAIPVTIAFYEFHIGRYMGELFSRLLTHEFSGATFPQGKIEERLCHIFDYAALVLLFYPVFMFSLIIIERRVHKFAEPVVGFGNISYSSYLIHFTLQLVCVLVLPTGFMRTGGFVGDLTFLGFFVVLLSLSLCSYSFFERPTQKYLRTLLPVKATFLVRPAK